ncbi:hypothetical protein Tco_0995708 [Tanacetum coccineum]
MQISEIIMQRIKLMSQRMMTLWLMLVINIDWEWMRNREKEGKKGMMIQRDCKSDNANEIMPMGCNNRNNFVDCGVFMMRHMETYKGNRDCCGFSREAKEQIEELRDLRSKYAEKILFAAYNLVKNEFELEAHAFKTLTLKEWWRLVVDAFKKSKHVLSR